jgi:hypothetical protein
VSQRLVPCPECRRHVRAEEQRCPFCGGARRAGTGTAPAIALAAIAVVAGCESGASPPPQAPTAPEATAAPTTAPPDAPKPALSPGVSDAGPREPAAVYGGPPPR